MVWYFSIPEDGASPFSSHIKRNTRVLDARALFKKQNQ